eukprot:gnl/MRDRNA2_/MRDRNA2_104556_c0_seq1.p1 gnl/MRDRNA2_/MRDRNA2_104556_c0~~gnl/MRDRNA2_/MRDRNA2_104556_c0_seq1.p1  ORF type:complete len:243 (+),score=37.03 gnl/MRDRNA2_/MRDRNA2_104556_c0_seq1:168-896(+)
MMHEGVAGVVKKEVGDAVQKRNASVAGIRAADVDCVRDVQPIDPSPIRSPQAVHTFLLPYLRNKEVVEVGTRNGDGMNCFARVTRSAIAIELDPTYCRLLQQRSTVLYAAMKVGYKVICNKFPKVAPDGDIYTWWQQEPYLMNIPMLQHLRRLYDEGRIRKTAEVIILIDTKYHKDTKSWQKIQAWASWHQKVPFDEQQLCNRLIAKYDETKDRTQAALCSRAHGFFIVAAVPIQNLPAKAR